MDYNKYWEKGMTYTEYLNLIDDLLEKGMSTGPNQTEDLFEYSKLNRHRMKRLDKTFDTEKVMIASGSPFEKVLVITEGWCGDAAQIVPVIDKYAKYHGHEIRYVLRDENLELMDAHLVNGGRSIPVVLFMNKDFTLVHQWGPRPDPAQAIVMEFKKQSQPKLPYSEISKQVQLWYTQDKQQTMIAEWNAIINS